MDDALILTAVRRPFVSLSWFHQSNFSSFQRQLYAYGFRRVTCESAVQLSVKLGTQVTWLQRSELVPHPYSQQSVQIGKPTITRSSCVANPMVLQQWPNCQQQKSLFDGKAGRQGCQTFIPCLRFHLYCQGVAPYRVQLTCKHTRMPRQ
jgi:HSF-type DNA-binding